MNLLYLIIVMIVRISLNRTWEMSLSFMVLRFVFTKNAKCLKVQFCPSLHLFGPLYWVNRSNIMWWSIWKIRSMWAMSIAHNNAHSAPIEISHKNDYGSLLSNYQEVFGNLIRNIQFETLSLLFHNFCWRLCYIFTFTAEGYSQTLFFPLRSSNCTPENWLKVLF